MPRFGCSPNPDGGPRSLHRTKGAGGQQDNQPGVAALLDTLTSEDFLPLLEATFETSLGDTPLVLTLAKVDVKDARYSRPGARLAFSLIFHGPAEPLLPQGTYSLRNATLGELALFTVPLGPVPGEDGLRYEVIFS